MGRTGSKLHEDELEKEILRLESDGFRVIDLKGRSPDAIAVRDNKIYAVEVLGSSYRKGKGWHKSWTVIQKEDSYSMFDDIIIKVFRYPKDITRKA